ncbi:MAG: protein kinase domain-containing protein [Planctomycetota bacterium]
MPRPKPPEQKSLVGYTIGKCKLLRICGRGAMGTVYKGMHGGLDIAVAVKILPPHLANNSTLVERFSREAKLAARLNHANTVRVYDVGEESGYHFLVMEFVEGTDALELIKKYGPQKAAVVADIAAGAARALAHAHEHDVVHRDIKPANLMLPETGGVKVADFGLARALASDSGLTMTGAIMGTPDYMAPEQAQGEFTGAPADIYSLGATMYHLFVGRPPFRGENPMAVALQHVTGRIVVPEKLIQTNSDGALARVIHECTQKEMAQRPDNLHALERQLLKIARATKKTQKLMTEGATLFSTTGYKLDTVAIAKQKEVEAAAEMSERGGVQSPHLDNLRKAAEKARGNVGGQPSDIQPPKATPPAGNMSADLAELTGDMVREAKARSRRSSGQIKALPPEGQKSDSRRMSSSPAMSPHREEGSAASSRRSKIVTDPELDDKAWESYAAKSFPTFESGVAGGGGGGSASSPANESGWDGGGSASNVTNPSALGYQAPVGGPTHSEASHYTPRSKKKSPVGTIITIVVVAALAGAVVYFGGFLDGPGGNSQDTHDPSGSPVALTAHALKGHPDKKSVFAISVGKKEDTIFTADHAGNVFQWGSSADPVAQSSVKGNVLCLYDDNGRNLSVGTSEGKLFLLDARNLNDDEPEQVLSLRNASVTSLTKFDRKLVVGDSSGSVRFANGSDPVEIQAGKPVVGVLAINKELWVVAGNRFAILKVQGGQLKLISGITLKGTATSMTAAAGNVFVAVKGEIIRLTPSGGLSTGVKIDSRFIGADRGARWVVGIQNGRAIAYSPASETIVGSADLPSGLTVECIGPGRQEREFIVGGSEGELIAVSP